MDRDNTEKRIADHFSDHIRVVSVQHVEKPKVSLVLIRSNFVIPNYPDNQPWSLWAIDHEAEDSMQKRYLGRYEANERAREAFKKALEELKKEDLFN